MPSVKNPYGGLAVIDTGGSFGLCSTIGPQLVLFVPRADATFIGFPHPARADVQSKSPAAKENSEQKRMSLFEKEETP